MASKSMFKTILIITILILAFSCSGTKDILPGYAMYDSPNGIDKPGRIYRLGDDGKSDFLVEYLPVAPESAPMIIGEREQNKVMNMNAMLSFIGQKDDLSADLNAVLNKESNFKIKLGDAIVYKVSDADLRTIYPDLIKRLKEDITIFGYKNPKYFIVREAVTAKEIFIQREKNNSSDIQFNANVEELIKTNNNIKWKNVSKDEIKVTFEKGLFVFYKPEQIVYKSSVAGSMSINVVPFDAATLKKIKLSK